VGIWPLATGDGDSKESLWEDVIDAVATGKTRMGLRSRHARRRKR
jgi:hypothetical protein